MSSIKQHPNYVKFVLSFAHEGNYRQNLTKPVHYEDGFVFCTDTKILVAFKDQNFHNLTECHLFGSIPSSPDGRSKSVFENFESLMNTDTPSLGEIKMAEVDRVVEAIRQEYPEYRHKYIDCTECDGSGQKHCDCCDNDYDCDNCKGNGTITIAATSNVGKFQYPTDQAFIIAERLYGIGIMAKVSESLKLVDADTLELLSANSSVNKIFARIKGSDIYLVIMGLALYDDPEKTYLLLDI